MASDTQMPESMYCATTCTYMYVKCGVAVTIQYTIAVGCIITFFK